MFIEMSEIMKVVFIIIAIFLGFGFLFGNIAFWPSFFEIRRKQIALMQFLNLKYDYETQTIKEDKGDKNEN
jgi:hypothetical protein